jgi:thiamine biosynthesis lipoprotein
MDADALSTAAFVLGLTEGLDLIHSLDGVEAVFVTEDKQIFITSGLYESFTVTDASYTIEKR